MFVGWYVFASINKINLSILDFAGFVHLYENHKLTEADKTDH